MKTKKFLPIVMLVLALASCTSKDEKKATDVKEELPIVEVTTVTQENVKVQDQQHLVEQRFAHQADSG